MNEKLRESLSAMMDGEASDFEVRRLVAEADQEVSSVWKRYHAISDAMHGTAVNIDISDRVRSAIDMEESHGQAVELTSREAANNESADAKSGVVAALWKPLGGLAVAASVALAVVFSVQTYQDVSVEATVAEAPAATETAPASVDAESVQTVAAQPYTEEHAKRLEQYLLRHAENTAVNGGQQVVPPFARVVTFEVNKGE